MYTHTHPSTDLRHVKPGLLEVRLELHGALVCLHALTQLALARAARHVVAT